MTGRAHIELDFAAGDLLAIYLGRKIGDGMLIVEPAELNLRHVPAGAPPIGRTPALRMPEDIARALLDALAAHFGGTGEAQTLRQDYLAERARVDKMINHLTRENTGA